MKFGFLLDKTKITFDGITISPLKEQEEVVRFVFDEFPVANGWIYPPIKKVKLNRNEEKLNIKTEAYEHSIPFKLPATHQIKFENGNEDDDNRFEFLILCYGFLHGLYLLKDGYNYLIKTPYKKNTAHRFVPNKKDLKIGMSVLNNAHIENTEEIRKYIFAALHWFLISESYERLWEHFEAQYKVLDGVYKIAEKKKIITILKKKDRSHAKRPILIAKKFGLKIPNWADVKEGTSSSTLSILRNNLVHQALFEGEPIGYRQPKENYRRYFNNFNLNLICAVLGLNTKHLRETPTTRGITGWDLLPSPITPVD
ncbi:hypothetical protein [Maridesulfovibrio ferrireducens]|uniref:hypothetical protein n=1 Tax=Maridesulfovibrio ferrireducens TaxID=246191 RepID=UPI001A2CE3FC|nr:hypothetical protein [Maridesulfovibrio ferrireducens]MBI9109921.1 hypothetical protein [Maridesulfovibrio ferrireducens]